MLIQTSKTRAGSVVPIQGAPAAKVQQHEELWLLGQPPLSHFLDFVEEAVVDGARADRAVLTNEWRAANDYYQELERSEAGIVNSGTHRALDAQLEPLAAQIRAHPHYRRAFDTLPTDFGMVELDKLIVFQKHITRTFADEIMARSRRALDPMALFHICLPLEAPAPPVQICQVGAHRYVFRCESTDLRLHESTVFRAEQVPEYHSFGSIAGIIGVVVGFGCPFLQVVRVGNRVLLNNGYHRACALRALGVTHVPCIIQTATRVDEVQVAARGRVAEDPEFYFESARPPLLKDFFDPRIRKVLPIRSQAQLVEVTLEIRHLVEDPIAMD